MLSRIPCQIELPELTCSIAVGMCTRAISPVERISSTLTFGSGSTEVEGRGHLRSD